MNEIPPHHYAVILKLTGITSRVLSIVSGRLLKNLRPLSQVRRRRVAAWTQVCPAGALAIGGFGRSRCAADAGELWVLFGRFEDLSPLDGAGVWSKWRWLGL
jgi:hypothetical protein